MLSKLDVEKLAKRKSCPRCSLQKTKGTALCRRCRFKLPSHMRLPLEGIVTREEWVVANALRAAANYFDIHYKSILRLRGGRMNAILIDEAFMQMKPPRPNPYLSELLRAHGEGLLENLERSKSIRGRVESLLIPVLHTGEANMDTIAAKLGLSRQTLFRKLRAEGVTFEKVLDELRHKLALHYLSGKKASVHESAYLVGFSDPAAFSRAFKRWTGSSPRTMRNSKVENG